MTALTTATGTTVAGSVARYLPYGEERTSPTTTLSDYGFTGHKENRDLGLVYANFRYYVPEIGRFNKADTIVPEPGRVIGYNRYAYVNNNPVRYNDPTGHKLDDGLNEGGDDDENIENEIVQENMLQNENPIPSDCQRLPFDDCFVITGDATQGLINQLKTNHYVQQTTETGLTLGVGVSGGLATMAACFSIGAVTMALCGGSIIIGGGATIFAATYADEGIQELFEDRGDGLNGIYRDGLIYDYRDKSHEILYTEVLIDDSGEVTFLFHYEYTFITRDGRSIIVGGVRQIPVVQPRYDAMRTIERWRNESRYR